MKKLDIKTVLKILYEISKDDKFYFFSYGEDAIKTLIKQSNKENYENNIKNK